MSEDRRKDPSENQGEGDRESARRYNDHVREFVVYGDPARAAREAREALEGEEAARLRAAEKIGKARARPTRIERLEGLALRLRHLLTDLVARARSRVAARVGTHS